MTTTTALAVNIPLMVLFFALMTGIPMWLVFKRPDREPRAARAVPQYQRAYAERHAQARAQAAHAQAAHGQAAHGQAAHGQAARRPWTASA
jgi:ABC-type nickel/cobalt efflux system permease component RcnA